MTPSKTPQSLSEKVYGAERLCSFTSDLNDSLIDVIQKEDVRSAVLRLKEGIYGVTEWGRNHGNGMVMAKDEIVKLIDEIFGSSLSEEK